MSVEQILFLPGEAGSELRGVTVGFKLLENNGEGLRKKFSVRGR